MNFHSSGFKFKTGTGSTADNVKIIGGNNYNENIRMHPASNGYSSLILGAVAGDSGTGVGQWSLVRYPDANQNIFTIRHNSTDHIAIKKDGRVGFGTNAPSEKIQVEGNIRASGSYKIGANVIAEQQSTTLYFGDRNDNDYVVHIQGFSDNSNIVLNDGFINISGNTSISGSLSKTSGSFKIDHPLKPETHHLVHSFVEGPQADNLYRGVIDLHNGRATIDLDEWFGMTPGTFLALNRDIQAFVNNADTWDNVRAKVMGSQLVIECQNPESTATVSWLVIGERQDKEIHESSLTDDNGKVIVEPVKVG
jgi:hypothetical protein